jgi:hypothetical protein
LETPTRRHSSPLSSSRCNKRPFIQPDRLTTRSISTCEKVSRLRQASVTLQRLQLPSSEGDPVKRGTLSRLYEKRKPVHRSVGQHPAPLRPITDHRHQYVNALLLPMTVLRPGTDVGGMSHRYSFFPQPAPRCAYSGALNALRFMLPMRSVALLYFGLQCRFPPLT